MSNFCERFTVCFLISVAVLWSASAEEGDFFTSDNKVDCVNKMVDWCSNMTYPKEGAGMSMLSLAFTDDEGKLWRVFCTADSDGTNCTRNRLPWFSCSSDNNLTYNGVTLHRDSTDGVDDAICNTTKEAFNDIFIQNLSYNPVNITTQLNKGMEEFFEAMSDLQVQLDFLRGRIFNDCFPFCNRYPFDFDRRNPPTISPDVTNSEESNQLERE